MYIHIIIHCLLYYTIPGPRAPARAPRGGAPGTPCANFRIPNLRGAFGGRTFKHLAQVSWSGDSWYVGRGDETVGSPHRAQIVRFEFFELVLLLKLDKQFTVEQFETTVSQSSVPSPPS